MKKHVLKLILFISVLALLSFSLLSCDMMMGTQGSTPSGNNTNTNHSHIYSEWSVDTATCTLGGVQKRICTTCKYTETKKTEPLGHDVIVNEGKAATCTQSGYSEYESCSRCSYKTNSVNIPALSHDLKLNEGKAATCTDKGYDSYVSCSRCDYGNITETPAKGHTYGEWQNNTATCTSGGTETRKCINCDSTEQRDSAPVGHTLGNWKNNTATCYEGGEEQRECLFCSYSETRATEAKGHTLSNWKDSTATCTLGGTEYRYCNDCSYSESRAASAKGHAFSSWKENTATCTEAGEENRTCITCSHRETRATSALGHTYQNEICVTCMYSEKLVLVFDGKAVFNVVYTSDMGSDGKRVANDFVKLLRDIGIEVSDPMSDLDPDAVSEREIVIGTNAANRGTDASVSDKNIGQGGEMIKIVGNRIIIAGGVPAITSNLLNKYIAEQIGLTSSSENIEYLGVDSSYYHEKFTEYVISSIKIGSTLLTEYTLVFDTEGMTGYNTDSLDSFRDDLYSKSGYWLSLGTVANVDTYSHAFIIRLVTDAGDGGFRAYAEGEDFIVECAYAGVFSDAFGAFINELILYQVGDIVISDTEVYEREANVITYESRGAKGDGETCDFDAIYRTHEYANKNGLKVLGRPGANYYISAAKFTMSIPIKTDVDFCGATFTIDDRGDAAFAYRRLPLFLLARDNSEVLYGDSNGDGTVDDSRFANVTISYNTTKFDWLVGELQAKSLVIIRNSKHKDFIRHGTNQNSGIDRMDIFVVDIDGTVASDTPVAYDFDNITEVKIIRTDDKEITVENGNFYNICCRTVMANKPNYESGYEKSSISEYYMCDYQSYLRGFRINRANATIKNVTHRMLDEPELGEYSHVPSEYYDSAADTIDTAKFGSRRESYPYYGFFNIFYTYNFNAIDCELTGHTTYYEDKPATASTGWEVPDPVAMGTYDLVVEYSSDIHFTNVTQYAPTGLGDSRYWGIMSSNITKNLFFEGCEINRFDAHCSFWNATLIDTTIGHSFNVIGGGTLYAKGVTKLVGGAFITLRSDYGATFRGDIILIDCNYPAYPAYNTSRGTSFSSTPLSSVTIIDTGAYWRDNKGWTSTSADGAYWQWNFGYICYMPINVTLDNFVTSASDPAMFSKLPDNIFTANYTAANASEFSTVRYAYQITKSITFKNMPATIPVCRDLTNCKKLANIPITKENIG